MEKPSQDSTDRIGRSGSSTINSANTGGTEPGFWTDTVLVGVAVIVALISVSLEQMSTVPVLLLVPITVPVILPYSKSSTLTSYFDPAANGSVKPSVRSTVPWSTDGSSASARYVSVTVTVARSRSKPAACVRLIVWSVVSVPFSGTSKEEISWGLVNANDAPELSEYSTSVGPVRPVTVKLTKPSSNSDRL